MTEVKKIRQSIFDRIKNILPNKVWFAQAPKGVGLPYIVYNIINSNNDYDTGGKIEDILIQVSAYALTQNELETVLDNVTNALDDCESQIVLTTYKALKFDRVNYRIVKDNDIYQADIDYKLLITQ